MESVRDRVTVVTGGASGIGRGTARAFATRGAKVVVSDWDADGAEAVAKELEAGGAQAVSVRCDVTSDDSFAELRDRTLERFGTVDIVMNTVGAMTRGLMEHVPVSEWQRQFEANLLSVVRSSAAFVPLLTAQGSGHVINTASFAGLYTYAYDRMSYAATKAGVVQLSEGMSLYLRPKGVNVTLLCPGPVATNITANMPTFGPPTKTRSPGAKFPVKSPEDVGHMVVDAVESNQFLLVTDDQVLAELQARAKDWDGYLNAMAARFEAQDAATA